MRKPSAAVSRHIIRGLWVCGQRAIRNGYMSHQDGSFAFYANQHPPGRKRPRFARSVHRTFLALVARARRAIVNRGCTNVSRTMAEPELAIPDLDDEERDLLRELALLLRDRRARNLVAREAFDRVARQLEEAAAR